MFRPQPWSMYDEGIRGSENGAWTMEQLNLGPWPVVLPRLCFWEALAVEGAAARPGLQELGREAVCEPGHCCAGV